jgi:hypothetical protein
VEQIHWNRVHFAEAWLAPLPASSEPICLTSVKSFTLAKKNWKDVATRGLKALVNRLADLIAAASVAFGRDRRGWMIDVSVVRVHQHGACVAQNERRAANRTKTTDQQDKAESASGPNAKSSMALG